MSSYSTKEKIEEIQKRAYIEKSYLDTIEKLKSEIALLKNEIALLKGNK